MEIFTAIEVNIEFETHNLSDNITCGLTTLRRKKKELHQHYLT